MDPLSHLVLGASLGQATLSRRLGRWAPAAGAVAAVLPDVDVLIRSASDPLLNVEHHRGFTHALAFAPAGAAVVTALFAARRRADAPALFLCALLGWVSHELLDASTSFGTQLLWPFSKQRVGWDAIGILDPFFTLALLVPLALALRRRSPGPARLGLGLAAAYLALGAGQHARALAAVERLAASRGHEAAQAEALPTVGNHLVFRTLYLHDGRLFADRVRVGPGAATFREGWSLERVTAPSPEEQARDRGDDFARFAWFCDGLVARDPRDPAILGDARYSRALDAFDPVWGIRFGAHGVEWVDRSRERSLGAGALLREALGDDGAHRPVP